MKKILLLSLLGISMCACSNEEENEATAVNAKAKEVTPETYALKAGAADVLNKYIKNQEELSSDEATTIFAADAEAYLNDMGVSTQGLNDSDIINLFFSNI